MDWPVVLSGVPKMAESTTTSRPILGSWNVIRVLNATEINQLAINGKSRELRDLRRTSKMGRLYTYLKIYNKNNQPIHVG